MTYILFVPPVYFNVKQYGAQGDGATDDTAAIAAAIAAASAAGGGTVFLPQGTYISGNQTLTASVHLRGAGINATILKLKNGANTDLLSAQTSSINLSTSFGTGIAGTLFDFSIQDMTLDGNKSNQSSGPSYPLRFYGYGYIMHNLVIRNGFTGGVLSDWNGGSASPGNDSMESQWTNVKIHDNNGIGFQFGGPHDSVFANIISFLNGSHCFHFAPNSATCQIVNAHAWGPSTGVSALAFLVEALTAFSNCQAEGSDTVQVALLASGCTWFGGRIFSGSGSSSSGIQFGQSGGNTPYNGQVLQSGGVTTSVGVTDCIVESRMKDCDGTHGALWFANDGGWNRVWTHLVTSGSGTLLSTAPNATTSLYTTIEGITADGTVAKSGKVQVALNSQQAWTATNGTSDLVNINTFNKKLDLPNGMLLHGYSDNYTTEVWSINSDGVGTHGWHANDTTLGRQSAGMLKVNGTLCEQQSAVQTPVNNATLSTFNSGVTNGIVRVNPAGNVTGIILAVGTSGGQHVTILNESSNTLTLNTTPATSNVADSATEPVIAALTARSYVWDSGTSLWYRVA